MVGELDGVANEGPWSAWRLVDAARLQRFSGALVLHLEPRVTVYFRDGRIYYAEQSSDRDVSTRLIAEGLLTEAQATAGTIRLRGVEHLGQLFERVEGIDRGAIEFCVEQFTDELLMAIAHRAVTEYEVLPYERQRNGIDRWTIGSSVDDDAPDGPSDELDDPAARDTGSREERDDDRTDPIDRDTARTLHPTGRVRAADRTEPADLGTPSRPVVAPTGQTPPLIVVNPSAPVPLVTAKSGTPAAPVPTAPVMPKAPPIPIVAEPEPPVFTPPTLSVVESDPTPAFGTDDEAPHDALAAEVAEAVRRAIEEADRRGPRLS